ncbi:MULTISPECIES: CDP-2,3-bis-(O-geranylgeranyl)-sn-glycerol synthase [unclassified Haladaptatus]|uniref:CDP-2,3-bis-(O-geranylgeranyl)-sn-glycerol synthase n=1 Tax=unclassified Haladaptatus TaxID=2622732 RepID=UPI0023E83105|nr:MULTISPECIES: CDP-2,3-bis-(O-geranylgeranyl)-sn-glycerol synthase [unclassified Haladaptatus]
MGIFAVIAIAFWAMLPAYIPNNAAVLFGGGPPIDGGRTWRGRRILGDGKTWRGTAAGTLIGVLVGVALNAIRPSLNQLLDFTLPAFPLVAAFSLAFGAMLGDILASFIKRRSGRERGAAFPLLDQLDFVVVALLLTFLVATGWFRQTFTLPVIVTVLILTPVLHILTNVIAYVLGLKNEPW